MSESRSRSSPSQAFVHHWKPWVNLLSTSLEPWDRTTFQSYTLIAILHKRGENQQFLTQNQIANVLRKAEGRSPNRTAQYLPSCSGSHLQWTPGSHLWCTRRVVTIILAWTIITFLFSLREVHLGFYLKWGNKTIDEFKSETIIFNKKEKRTLPGTSELASQKADQILGPSLKTFKSSHLFRNSSLLPCWLFSPSIPALVT